MSAISGRVVGETNAQEVMRVFKAFGLDPATDGELCRDTLRAGMESGGMCIERVMGDVLFFTFGSDRSTIVVRGEMCEVDGGES